MNQGLGDPSDDARQARAREALGVVARHADVVAVHHPDGAAAGVPGLPGGEARAEEDAHGAQRPVGVHEGARVTLLHHAGPGQGVDHPRLDAPDHGGKPDEAVGAVAPQVRLEEDVRRGRGVLGTAARGREEALHQAAQGLGAEDAGGVVGHAISPDLKNVGAFN